MRKEAALLMMVCCVMYAPCRSLGAETADKADSPVKAGSPVKETAGVTPLQLAIWPPVQIFFDTFEVWGLRINAPIGNNRSVYGLDLGVLASTVGQADAEGRMAGLQCTFGGNEVVGAAAGMQIAGAINVTRGPMNGVQIGVLLNEVEGPMAGFQFGALMNMAHSTVAGVQIGFWNHQLGEGSGLQVGFINKARSGIQIGFLNFNEKGIVPYFPIVNIGF